MSLTQASLDAISKELYLDDISDVTLYDAQPFMASLKKASLSGDNTGGRGSYIPVRISPSPAVSGDPGDGTGFTRLAAQAAAKASTNVSFLITAKKLYGVAQLSTDSIETTDDSRKGFANAAVAEKDSLIQHIMKQLEQFMFEEGFGRIGKIAAISGADITLEDQCDGRNFEKDQVLVSASDVGTAAIDTPATTPTSVAYVNVTAANNKSVITMNNNVVDGTTGISASTAVGRYLFVRDNRAAAGSGAKNIQEGLLSYLPGLSTAHDSFYGVTRTGNSRLKGLYFDGFNSPLSETLVAADALNWTQGGKGDVVWCSANTLAAIQYELQGKIIYNEFSVSKTAGVNFKGIEYVGMSGNMIRIIASPGASDRRMFLLDSSGWSYRTKHEGVVRVYDADGVTWARRDAADAVQLRCWSNGQFIGTKMAHNVHINLAPTS